jgi:hypothetical protein
LLAAVGIEGDELSVDAVVSDNARAENAPAAFVIERRDNAIDLRRASTGDALLPPGFADWLMVSLAASSRQMWV